jgi:hypothetical protein
MGLLAPKCSQLLDRGNDQRSGPSANGERHGSFHRLDEVSELALADFVVSPPLPWPWTMADGAAADDARAGRVKLQ